MKDMSSVPGRHIDYAHASRTQEKNILFVGSDGVVEHKGPAEMDTHLRIATVDTIAASTCSLSPVVSGMPSRNRGDRTRTNNTRTDDPSVSSS